MTTLTRIGLAIVATAGLVVAGVSASYAVGDPHQGDDQGDFVPVLAGNQNAVTERGITGKPPVKPRPIADGAIVIGAPPVQGQQPAGADGAAAVAASILPKAPSKNWDRKLRSPLVKKIEAALENPTEVSFTDNPLEEALNYLEDLHHIEIWLDKQALQNEGVATDQQVTLVMTGTTLKSALAMILEPLALDYIIKNEVLVVTLAAKANEHFETRVYDVSRLKGVTPTELDQIIRSTIAPDTWTPIVPPEQPRGFGARAPNGTVGSGVMGGGGGRHLSREGNLRSTNTSLVIRQTQRLHEEIVDLLNQLDEVAAAGATFEPKQTSLPLY
jgi:type II secretory pathway component GspD/PulD (secretin)